MTLQSVSLKDRFDLSKKTVLLSGIQALVRLPLMQKARDTAAGHNTAGYVSGYRGSPLGSVDLQMARAGKELAAADVVLNPGLNEDLAATALWGTQQAELRGEGTHDGVFGLWYGKGPGVDRTGDVFRHANMAGTSRLGGVLACMGDDHTGESSTVLHQSEFAFVDVLMPILSPAGVQEVLDYGLLGWELSRYSGCWVGLKCVKDTIEVTEVVDGDPHRLTIVKPTDFEMPADGLNIRLADTPTEQEARLHDYKRFAAEAFGRANKIDKRMAGKRGAKIGIVSAGKSWLDTVHALDLLGLKEADLEALGITTYKVGMVWPLDMTSFREWAEDLELIICVEEKRKLIEVQIKEAIFDDRRGRRVYGWYKGGAGRMHSEELFPTRMALDPVMIAEKIGGILIEEGRGTESVKNGLDLIAEAKKSDNAEDIAQRVPYFCSGCPHNTSTRLPEGSRAYAGIGCHIMALWMDREVSGYTHMGGEGVNWVGEAPFSKTNHVFQQLGDGTYNHSGILAIRAALAAGTNITYKILYNDAVAMTGGQSNEGGLTPDRIAQELKAMGVGELAVVYDPKEEPDRRGFPSGLTWHERDELQAVQERMREVEGVSAILYIQTCAAEKRRRRKRGTFPDPDTRVFINTDICEGCGDCGVQSNCVAIVPVETELGRKRAIDQSACNKDFSCLKGFCPSFVTVEGAKPRKTATATVEIGDLPEPDLPTISGTWNTVITGVGGTGVVTIGAVLAQAAQLDGKGAGMIEMAGLAQKGGAVWIHLRLADAPDDISAIRVATGEADAIIGGDLVVTAGAKTLGLMTTGRTGAVVNSAEISTGDFALDRDFRIPVEDLKVALEARLRDGLSLFDASALARALLGDSIFSNMMVAGAAWQQGLIPLTRAAIRRAIELNGAAIEKNLEAFELGRWAALNPDAAQEVLAPTIVPLPKTLEDKIAFRADHLTRYQNARLARRYRKRVDGITDPALREAVAKSYHKLLAYKDEYEVARLHLETRAKAEEVFEGDIRLSYHLAPPMLPGTDASGRPKKRKFGEWLSRAWGPLAAMKVLRGTPLDPFGHSAERRAERRLIRDYEADLAEVLPMLSEATRAPILALAELPMQIRGFGPVKEEAMEKAARQRADLLALIRAGGTPKAQAAAE